MAGTQMQAPSLTSSWLWTSHIPAPGLQRLDDISGYFGCKTKIKTKNPVIITPTPGHLSICSWEYVAQILGIHQDLRCRFSLHFSLFHASRSLSGHLCFSCCVCPSLLSLATHQFSQRMATSGSGYRLCWVRSWRCFPAQDGTSDRKK